MSAHDAQDPTGGMTRRDLIAILGSMTAGAFFVPSLAEATEAHRIAGEAIAAAGGTFAPSTSPLPSTGRCRCWSTTSFPATV